MDLTDLEVGDKARITVEVDLRMIDFDDEYMFRAEETKDESELFLSLYASTAGVVSIEKIEPALKAGDLVRNVHSGATYLLLCADGDGPDDFRFWSFAVNRESPGNFPRQDYEVLASAKVAA